MSQVLAATLAMLLVSSAFAQRSASLVDPTRPPAVGPAAEVVVPEGPRLQSVLISDAAHGGDQRQDRGTWVIHDATVEAINEARLC
jgi:hypothetical protein